MKCIARDIQIMEQDMTRLARIEIDRQRSLARSRQAGEIRARLSIEASRFDLAALRATRIKRFHAVEFDDRMGRGIYEIELGATGQDRHFDTSSR